MSPWRCMHCLTPSPDDDIPLQCPACPPEQIGQVWLREHGEAACEPDPCRPVPLLRCRCSLGTNGCMAFHMRAP